MKLNELTLESFDGLIDRDEKTKSHDKYVQAYNKNKDKVQAVSNLITVQDGLSKQLHHIEGSIEINQKVLVKNIERISSDPLVRVKSDWPTYMMPEKNRELKRDIGRAIEKVEHISELLQSGIVLEDEFNYLKSSIITAYNRANKDPEGITPLLKGLIKSGSLFSKLHTHKWNLNFLIQEIVRENYPDKLKMYGELSEEKKEELRKVGRPFKNELPQSEVVSFIKSKLESKNKKRFIHQSGDYEGKPNWNHLADTFLENNPGEDKRNFIRRLKKAYKTI